MAGFKIELFKGTRPRISALKLPEGEGQTAENCNLGSGDAEPFVDKSTDQAVSSGRTTRTIYRYNNGGSPIWLEWDEDVDVVAAPVKLDTRERLYYTGDSQGAGAPKYTDVVLTALGDSAPYPNNWLYMGVPVPTATPSAAVVNTLPEDVPEDDRVTVSGQTFSDELLVDFVNFSTYPGTGTPDDIWRLAAGATGSIALNINIGSSFRVVSVVNANKVTLESVSEAGVFARTAASDKTNSTFWDPFEDTGSTEAADFTGFIVPTGAEVQIIGHRLLVGDVITVTAIGTPMTIAIDNTFDVYEQDWLEPALIEEAGDSFYQLSNARITPSATSGDTPWTINGSFFYDVDRNASTSNELEDRQYVYTFVSRAGEEGAPSPTSDVAVAVNGQTVRVTGIELPPTIGYDITHIRIYRTNATEAGTEFQFVAEINAGANAYNDIVDSADLGEVIRSTTWDPPDTNLRGLTEMPNGMLVGFQRRGKTLYFCEPYFPHAWPADYDQAIGHEIVGIAAFGNALAIMTKAHPYVLTGSHPRNVNIRPIKFNQACVSKRSITTDRDRVYYASPDGIVEISVNGIRLATDGYMDKKDWETYSPETMVGAFHEGRYYGFYDFDDSIIDAVISAEISGTVTSADEADIINGGSTIIITLTNDTWVEAGAAFDAERQDIIDGLTAATDQTNGWNAEVRDTELSVTDVVRTSDTVVTITLPTASDYSVSLDEVITVTIPADALDVSGSAVVAGSTFTVTALTPDASVSIGGSLDGSAEAAVVAGGETITLTLTNDTWVEAGATFNAQRQGIIDGLASSTNETNGFNDTVPNLIPVANVVRTSDTVVTITLPAVPAYNITLDETITCVVPSDALEATAPSDLTTLNSIYVTTASVVARAVISGTVITADENDIVAGGNTLIITLTNDTFVAAGTGPIGSTADTQALIDGIVATTSQTLGWNNVVNPGIETADVVRTSATVATITLDAESTYSIATFETIEVTVPAAVLTAGAAISASNTFGIVNQDPILATLTGTITDDAEENDIVAGGLTIILTLASDTWVAAGATFDAERQNIIDGLTSAQSETNGWNNEVRDTDLSVTDVVRTSDTVVTVTLPASAGYAITAQETITATIPATAMSISSSAVVAAPTFTVDQDVPTSAAITGTADNATSADIVVGGKTIIITLTSDTWVASGAVFNNVRQAIIQGLDAASTPSLGWNEEVRDAMPRTAVVRTSNTVVTITLPETVDYDVNVAEAITVTIPASALQDSLIAVVASNTVDITPESTAVTRLLWGFNDNNSTTVINPIGSSERSHYDLTYGSIYKPPFGSAGDSRFPKRAAYSASEGRWVTYMKNEGANTHRIYTSDDDGESYDLRTGAHDSEGAFAYIYRHEGQDRWLAVQKDSAGAGDDYWQYSADGTTWVDITANVLGGISPTNDVLGQHLAGKLFNVDSAASRRAPVFFYGGANYIYALLHEEGTSWVDADQYLVRSADLSSDDVDDDWSAAIPSAIASGAQGVPLMAVASGNGKILALTRKVPTNPLLQHVVTYELEYVTHGATSFTEGTSDFIMGTPPTMMAFGASTFVMVNEDGDLWYCDTTSLDETDADDWTFVGNGVGGGNPAITFTQLFYDGGTTGANGQGFIAVGEVGTGPATEMQLWQSADGITWTLERTVGPACIDGTVWPERPLDGTDLD